MPRRTPYIADLDTVFLTCRTVGHAWEAVVVFLETTGRREVHRTQWVCDRERRAGIENPTEKEVTSYAHGNDEGVPLEQPRYRHPDGYLVEEHIGRGRQRPIARVALNERLLEGGGSVAGRTQREPANRKAATGSASSRKARKPSRRRR